LVHITIFTFTLANGKSGIVYAANQKQKVNKSNYMI